MDDFKLTGISSIELPDATGAQRQSWERSEGGFLSSLKEAIAKTNEVQLEANQAVEKLMAGDTQNVHQTMVALERADASFQLMMQIRNKIVTAYEDIQRMQI